MSLNRQTWRLRMAMQSSRERKGCNTIRTRETDGDHAEYPSKPPLQVTVEAQKVGALPVPGDGPGVWLLVRDGVIVGRAAPRQLTEG